MSKKLDWTRAQPRVSVNHAHPLDGGSGHPIPEPSIARLLDAADHRAARKAMQGRKNPKGCKLRTFSWQRAEANDRAGAAKC